MNNSEYSSQIRKEAGAILKKYKIIEYLNNFGEVEIIGSYKLDLMWQKDIDIYIKNSEYPMFNKLLDIIKNCFRETDIYYFKIENNIRLIKPNLPKGFGIFIKLNSGWKFDLWFVHPEESQSKERITSELFQNYKREMKEDILQYKKLSITKGVYNKNFTSYDLYKAIIENNIESITKYF